MSPSTLSLDLIQKAQASAKAYGRAVMAEIENVSQLEARQVVHAVAEHFGWQVIQTVEMYQLSPAFDLVSLSKAMQRHCLLMRDDKQQLIGILADPFDINLTVWLEMQAKAPISFRLSLSSDIGAYISKSEESVKAMDHLSQDAKVVSVEGKKPASLSFASISDNLSPAVKLVNSTLYDALKAGASDIHLESTPQGLTVKYRVDGVLDLVAHSAGLENAEQVVSRLKVLAELDISERRIPQDGSFRVDASGREVDLSLIHI